MRRKIEPSEHDIQCAFVQWCRMSESKYPALKLAFAVPNGANRHIVTAMKNKREGQRAGVPDWVFPARGWMSIEDEDSTVKGRIAHSLMLEFKRPGQRATREQKQYHSLAKIYGHRVEIVTSAEQAISIVKEYLS
jgi:hypothetical protein